MGTHCGKHVATDAFEYLGSDITLEIISWLDNGSVVALLNSIPWLKKEAIILTDHDLPLTHFNICGVKRKFIGLDADSEFFLNHSSAFFAPSCDREPIRLIEMVSGDIDYSFLPGNIWSAERTRHTNRTTFIFISPCCNDCPRLDSRLYDVVNESSTIKMVIGTPSLLANESFEVFENTYFDEESGWHFPNLGLARGYGLSLNQGDTCLEHCMETLETLRIESSSTCIGISLPRLKQLSIIFSTAVNVTPIIESVSAPELTHLVVHFNLQVPVMKSISVGQKLLQSHHDNPITNFRDEVESSKAGVFELARISSLQINRDPFGPIIGNYEDQSVYDSIDMAFTKAFLVQLYTGVPDFIVRKSDLTEVGILRWHLSCPLDSTPYSLSMPRLHQLMIHLSESHTMVPVMSCPNLKGIGVLALSHSVDISSLWQSSFPKLKHFELHQTINLIKSFKETGVNSTITISSDEWFSFISNNGSELSHVSLTGFEMSFLSNCQITKHMSFPGDNSRSNRSYGATLRPFIPNGSRLFECKIAIGAKPVQNEEFPEDHMNYIKVSPIFENQLDKGKAKLLLTGIEELSSAFLMIDTCVQDW